MALLLSEKNRPYQRIQLNQKEKKALLNQGLIPVVSSNVSAIAKQGASLIVRFHGGALYEYPTSGRLYAEMLNSSSKGKFVWNRLRRAGVAYKRIGSMPMDYDKNIDRDIMQEEDLKKAFKEAQKESRIKYFNELNIEFDTLVKATRAQTLTAQAGRVLTGVAKAPPIINPLLATTLLAPKDFALGIITALAVSEIIKERSLTTEI